MYVALMERLDMMSSNILFADLVALPEVPHPIPSRTRSLSPPGPMVLCLKARESRSLPGLPGACDCDSKLFQSSRTLIHNGGFGRALPAAPKRGRLCLENVMCER